MVAVEFTVPIRLAPAGTCGADVTGIRVGLLAVAAAEATAAGPTRNIAVDIDATAPATTKRFIRSPAELALVTALDVTDAADEIQVTVDYDPIGRFNKLRPVFSLARTVTCCLQSWLPR
jgi:hypothetical protein